VENVKENVATNVRLARQRVGLSQEELADKAGIDRTYASGIERAVRNPTILILAKLADALGTKVADLLSEPSPVERKARR
jgi:transcriptional regulator with XRE-family HTH domain